jgi:preprotein translocase subunit SecD
MRVEHCQGERCIVWVSPTAALTEGDIEQAQPEVSPNAGNDGGSLQRIRIVFTKAAAAKLHELTTAQLRSHIALVVDDKVLWAPTVNGTHNADYNESMLAGSTGHGLAQEEVDLIMSILRPGQPR